MNVCSSLTECYNCPVKYWEGWDYDYFGMGDKIEYRCNAPTETSYILMTSPKRQYLIGCEIEVYKSVSCS